MAKKKETKDKSKVEQKKKSTKVVEEEVKEVKEEKEKKTKKSSSKKVENKKNDEKKNSNKKEGKKQEKISDLFDDGVMHFILVAGIIILVFCLFYIITVYITNHLNNSSVEETEEKSISYSEILVGRSFDMPEEEYLVVYYDFTNTDLASSLASSISTYNSNDSHHTLYTADLNNTFNQKYVSSEGNKTPKDAASLAINGATLIHFKDGKVVDYVEGLNAILNYLA